MLRPKKVVCKWVDAFNNHDVEAIWKDPLGLRDCGFFHVVNGKILFQRGYWDKLSFLKQHNLSIDIERNE